MTFPESESYHLINAHITELKTGKSAQMEEGETVPHCVDPGAESLMVTASQLQNRPGIAKGDASPRLEEGSSARELSLVAVPENCLPCGWLQPSALFFGWVWLFHGWSQ